METTPHWYSIIPASVRYDDSVTANAKLMYGEITALANREGYCWATNAYFADLYGVSQKSVTRYVKQLEDAGHVIVEMVRRDDGTTERRIRLPESIPPDKNVHTPGQKCPYPPDKNVHHININDKYKDNKDIVRNVVSMLNERTGQRYRESSRKTQSLIMARIREGYTIDDFERVINSKASEWMNDERMRRYLRPETLFGTKFEGYLNAAGSMRLGYDGEGWL